MTIIISTARRVTGPLNLSQFQRNRITSVINTLRAYNSSSEIEAWIYNDIKLIINDFRNHNHSYYDLVNSITGYALNKNSDPSRIF